jgi:hypothetical protein
MAEIKPTTEGAVMYLKEAKTIDEIMIYGIEPAILYAGMVQDGIDGGLVDGEKILLQELQAKLYLIKEKLEELSLK